MRHMAQLRAMFGCRIAKVVRKIQIMEWPRLRQSLHYSTHYSIQSVYFGHNSVKTWQLLLPFSTSSILASSYSTVDILNVLQRYLYFPVQPPTTIILIVGLQFGIFYRRSKKRMKVIFSKIRTHCYSITVYNFLLRKCSKKNSTIIFAAEIDFSPSYLCRCYYLKAKIVEYLWRLSFGASLYSED